jgi:hypothetical protein
MVVIMIGRKRSRQACRIDCFGAQMLLALGLQREVDHHDAVLLDDADQQDDADQRDHRQVEVEDHQHQQRADAGRRQRREDGQRVDVALVEHAEDDVDHHQRRQDQ